MLCQRAILILFFITASLKSSEQITIVDKYRNDRLTIAHSGFDEGLQQFNKGNTQEAKHILLGAYYRVEKHDPQLLSIDPQCLIIIYDAIIKTQLLSTNLSPSHIDRAIAFAQKSSLHNRDSLTNTGLILIQRAAQAHTDNNNPLKQECYRKSFQLFEQERTTNSIAKTMYENALCSKECEYNATKVVDYFLTNLKRNSIYTVFSEHTVKERNNILYHMNYLAHNGNMRAQCILASVYKDGKYDIPISHDKVLHYCKQYILSLGQFQERLPNEHFSIFLALKSLSFKNKTAATLNIYHNFLHAIHTKNTVKINALLATTNVKTLSLRPFIMKMLSAELQESCTYLRKIKKVKPSDKKFKNFCESDGFIVIPLLKQQLEVLTDKTSPLANALNYFLGICAYHEQHYLHAYQYFMQCNHYYNDLLTQCLILETYNRTHTITTLESIDKSFSIVENLLPLLAIADLCQKPRDRDTYAKTILSSVLEDIYVQYHDQLLQKKHALPLSKLAYFMMHLPETQENACKLLTKIINFINPELSLYCNQKEIVDYQHKTYRMLEDLAKTKNHMSYLCNTAGAQMLERVYTTHRSDKQYNILKAKAFSHYLCAFTHTNCSQELTQSIKSTCASLSYDLGKAYKSPDYINQAITFDNPRAFRLKALYLSQQPNAQEHVQKTHDLLTLHTETNDLKRSYSYNDLALYLLSTTQLENDKKGFLYLQKAIDLGNFDYASVLGKFYASGIQEKNGQYYLHPNLRHAIHYYTEHIAHTNNRFTEETFFHRGLAYYKLNCLSEAYDDFNENFLRTKDLRQQALSLFMKSIINIQIEQDNIICPTAINDLRTAHQKIKTYNQTIKPQIPLQPEIFIQYMDEKAFIAAEALLANIINTKNTSIDGLDWCEFMGYLFWKSVCEKPIANNRRKKTINFLIHAADNGLAKAQWTLSFADVQEVPLSKKVGYLNALLKELKPDNYDLLIPLKNRLTTLFPLACENQPAETNQKSSTDDQIHHKAFSLLVDSLSSADLKNKQFKKALDNYTIYDGKDVNLQFKLMERLANKTPNHTHASLLMATKLCVPLSNGIDTEQYMKNAFVTGLIRRKNKHALFKDKLVLNLIYQLISKNLIKAEAAPYGARLIKTLKLLLKQNNVNIEAFLELLNDSYGCKLDTNPAWR